MLPHKFDFEEAQEKLSIKLPETKTAVNYLRESKERISNEVKRCVYDTPYERISLNHPRILNVIHEEIMIFSPCKNFNIGVDLFITMATIWTFLVI